MLAAADVSTFWLPFFGTLFAGLVAAVPLGAYLRKRRISQDAKDARIEATADAVLGHTADANTGRPATDGLVTMMPEVLRNTEMLTDSTEKLTKSLETLKGTVTASNRKLDQHLVDARKILKTVETRLDRLEGTVESRLNRLEKDQ